MDPLQSLQEWYASQCNGEWEHRCGIRIETCDNPGWWVKIDLVGTPLMSRPFSPIAANVNPDGFPRGRRWLCCRVSDGVWHGAGDETKLPTIVDYFLTWAASEG